QGNYGNSQLSAVSGALQPSPVRVENEEQAIEADPGNAIAELWVMEDDQEFAVERAAVVEDSYVEEVDLALEQWSRSTPLLGKPAVASFGEMVARRGVKPRVH